MEEKANINVVFIGHVDHGKSTLVGRTLLETGRIDKRIIEKYEKMGEKGKTFKFAWVMDKTQQERERGLTIEVTHQDFETKKNKIFIIDAPGHSDFVKNMITGASEADAAILVVAADDGVMPQTKEHALLARTMGLNQLIVAVNKIDLANYDEKRYIQLEEQVKKLLKLLRWDIEEVPFIPVSAFHGDNVVEKSENLTWYKGPTFLEALDTLTPETRELDRPFRMPIDDVFHVTGAGTVVAGVVNCGKISVNDPVLIVPSGLKSEVRTIEQYHQRIQTAQAGNDIGINLRGIAVRDIHKGDVLCCMENPPANVKEFMANLTIFGHPTSVYTGYTPTLHVNTDHVACTLTEVVQKTDPHTGGITKNPTEIRNGETAIVRMKPVRPIIIEESSESARMSRFVIRDMRQTIGAGICVKIVETG